MIREGNGRRKGSVGRSSSSNKKRKELVLRFRVLMLVGLRFLVSPWAGSGRTMDTPSSRVSFGMPTMPHVRDWPLRT